MKNAILLVGALLTICIAMGSCKKDYICKCSKIYTSGNGTNIPDYSTYAYTDKKGRAEDRCKANASTGGDFSGEYGINCQIE